MTDRLEEIRTILLDAHPEIRSEIEQDFWEGFDQAEKENPTEWRTGA